MKLRQKMVAITMGGALISVLLGTLLVYIFVKNILIENESKKLSSVTGHMVSSASKRFVESYDKLTSFARLLTIELAKPKSKEDLNSFYRLMEKNADGVWRNKKSLFDGQVESGVFLPSNSHENDTQKIQHARIKHIMDSFGASSDKLFENVWYLSLDRSEIIFDKNLPNFVFEQPANNDYTQTPWVTYTLPELNPNREVRFTPPLFDPVPKIWMVSAIYPLYQNEKWIGSIGEDLRLTDVLAFLFKEDQLYKDTQHFLIDNQGNFILAGDWQSNIEANNQLTKLNFESEPRLAELFQKQINNEPQVLSTDLWIQNKQYIAIGMTIKPVNWRYFHVVPVDEIIATTRQLFINLLGMILAVGTLNGLFTFYFSGRNITNRIKILANTMVIYAKVHRGRIADRLSGDDEISQLGLVFDNMANEIDQNIEALSHRNELLQSVFDISQSGYLLFDPQEKVLLANQTLSIILGFPIDSLLNITANEFWDRLAKQTKFPLISLNKNIEFFRIDLILPKYRNLLCKKTEIILDDGCSLGKLYFFHDISKEEEANRIKNEFLIHATHELRTPLTTIHGYSKLLEGDLIPLEMQSEVISVILNQSTWMISMIHELLDLNRLTERNGEGFEMSPYLLNNLILDAISEFHVPSGRDEIAITPIVSDTTINVDKTKFTRVLHNILDNAFKYSPKGGAICLTVHESEDAIEIEISDQGIGIAPENFDLVFERFFRVDKSGNIPGIGLGLTIAKEIMHFFNGDIRITSLPNQGCSVILHFNI